ncbi:hypothetical protein G4B84_002284, partial [Aspergillus flavus NRRL3357]
PCHAQIPRRILALLQIRELLEDQDIDTGRWMLSFSSQSVGAEDSLSTIRLPDASVDPELLADDIVQLAARGADSISQDGKMTVNVSSVKEATSYMLYASYARRSYARACTASSENHQNILQNGSFAVDHFSVMGAKVTTSFLKEYIFIDRIKELMEETGNLVWEDSVEIPSYTYWTLSLPEIFKKQHGYAMTPYLMLLSGNEGYQTGNQGPIQFISDGNDQGAGFVADYRSTMTGLLMEYLEYLNKWTHETLGLKSSQQVGYNLPVDMLEAIPSVDIPETETLSFSNLIAGFRQFSGPANLAGKNVISIELGANFGQAYYQTWTELLQEAKHAFVAGHSRHQPGWDVGYKQAMDYSARCQFILQGGIAKVDLVFWDKQTAQDAYPGILYEPTDLQDAGDVYVYVYNDGDFSTGSISFQATGSPFAPDAWTGEETPITEYSVSQGRTNISFSLKSTETRIVKFSASRNSANNESHVIWSSDSVLGYYVDSGKVWAKAAASDSATSVKLSSGKTVTLDQQGQSQISLGNWSVVLEQWLPPDNLYDVETVANKKNVSFFFWPKEETGATGAYLVIPPVSHGIRISINGNEVPVIDITNPTTDVSTYLVQGDNTVVITVSSTLHNGLMPIWDQLLTGGAAPSLNYSALEDMVFQPQEYGILGEVRVVPYQLMRII